MYRKQYFSMNGKKAEIWSEKFSFTNYLLKLIQNYEKILLKNAFWTKHIGLTKNRKNFFPNRNLKVK